MFRFSKSIYWKITIWHSMIIILMVSVFSGLLYMAFSDSLNKEVDSMLAREEAMIAYCIVSGYSFSEIENHLNGLPDSIRIQKEEMYWQIENEQGQLIAASKNLNGQRFDIAETTDRGHKHSFSRDPELNGIPLRAMSLPLLTQKRTAYTITVAIHDRIRHVAIDQLRNIIILCNIGLAAISIVIGLLISRKTLKPIKTIVKATHSISATNLHKRLPIEGSEDELQLLAKTLNGMIDRLETSFAQIQQFTSDVSHELRTSLTILRGEIEVALIMDRSAEEYKRVLHSVLEEIIYLFDMVKKFLDLSQKTSSPKQIVSKDVDGIRLFDYVGNHLSSVALNKQIKLQFRIPKAFTFYGDEDLLRRLFVNLIENAIKYTPEGGTVAVQVSSKGEFIQVEVIDNGMGIPEEHLPFIFQRFYRADNSRTRSQGGTGLGLALCKWIVEVHEGMIEVRSKPHHGTTVTVTLLAR